MSTLPDIRAGQPDFEPRRPLDDALVQGIGATATPETEAEQTYIELSREQLLAQYLAAASTEGIDVARPKNRLGVNEAAHDLINGYHQRKHKYEWSNEVEGSEAPPLPLAAMHARLLHFYDNPDIQLWQTDGVHLNRLHELHEKSERYTTPYRFKIPEIDDVIKLQEDLKARGYKVAGDMLCDLLAVYAEALKAMIVTAAQHRERQRLATETKNRSFEA